MFARKLFLIILLSSFVVSAAFSTIHRVDNNPANNPDFTTLQAAHDAATGGDTIYVSGSVSDYGSLTLSKTLYMFGPGYFLSENPETSAKLLTASIINFTFAVGSEGSLITGFIFRNLTVNADNVTFKRNRLNPTGNTDITIEKSNVIICQNHFHNTSSGLYLSVQNSSLNVIIRNNHIHGIHLTLSVDETSSADIRNNVMFGGSGGVGVNNSTFYNNILRQGTFTATNCDVQNNIGNSTQFGTANGNQENVDMNTVFVGTGSTDGMWQLAPGSPAIGAGVLGEDCGMFGGNDPYVLSGLPAIPAIYFFIAPASVASDQVLPVQVKIKSHN